ncbi:MAG: Polyketide cyclase / dehydrase and lipid transport [Candidatus Binatota bacterium]|nr:Polyketide cyclase / dehydrase and lipid transport [Candidatus Binatota bacterium]
MKGILYAVIGVVVVAVVALGWWYWKLQQAAVQWDSAKEIVYETIEKDGQTWHIEMHSLISKPADKVWNAMKQPERAHEFIDSFKKSELKSNEGGKKVVEIQAQVLTLPTQTFVIEFTFDEGAKRMMTHTLQGPQDLNGTYELVPSPDGQKTLLRYTATATDKVNIPLPVSAQKGAVKELFVKTVRAIEKGVEDADKKAASG